jgi:hypothetical protein
VSDTLTVGRKVEVEATMEPVQAFREHVRPHEFLRVTPNVESLLTA